ncbi:MAG: hypothetical protein M3040_00110 [Bacteroidota bacterium]|nr:hypothetical protein [Bacteroidota bacterium]
MNKDQISIATITLARDEQEEQLLRTALHQLSQLNIPVYITDGGSRPGFLAFLAGFPQFIVSKKTARGVWEQAKNSLIEASETCEYIFYTEPDKYEFFGKHLTKMIESVHPDEKIGVVLASRSACGFASFPAFQQMTETTINNCCAELIGKTTDFTYGPFLLRSTFVQYLKLVKDDIGWGWRPFVFNIANRLGFNVGAYVADFSCPPSQQQDTAAERIYRMKQLKQNIEGMVLSTAVSLA